ncbi:MAG: O-antigen ligase family protein [Pseudomonadota bacterium]
MTGQAFATAAFAVAAGAMAVVVAGSMGLTALSLGAPVALFGGMALLAQPFAGVAALAAFSHLDGVQKLLFAFLPVSAFKLLTALTAAALLLNAQRLRDRFRDVLREPVIVMAIVFLLLAGVSLAAAEDRALALGAIRRLSSLALLLVLVAVLADTRRKVDVLLWLLVGTSVVSSIILLVDFAFGVQLVAQSDAATTARTVEGVARSAGGSDYNPTTAASLLLVGVIFALVHALESPRWRWPLLIVVAIGTTAIVLSFARSAALAYGLVGLALLWRHRRWRYLPVLAVVGLLAGLALLPLVPAEYLQRLSSIVGGAPDPTLGRRLSYNLIGIDLLLQRPLLGVGPGNYTHHFIDMEYRFMPGRILLGRELHNMYLSVLVQHGLIGALPFFAMIAMSFGRLREVCATAADPEYRTQALSLGYAFAAYLLTCVFLPSEEIKYTWLIPGLAVSLYLANLNEPSRR